MPEVEHRILNFVLFVFAFRFNANSKKKKKKKIITFFPCLAVTYLQVYLAKIELLHPGPTFLLDDRFPFP